MQAFSILSIVVVRGAKEPNVVSVVAGVMRFWELEAGMRKSSLVVIPRTPGVVKTGESMGGMGGETSQEQEVE